MPVNKQPLISVTKESRSYSLVFAFLLPALLAGIVYYFTSAPSLSWRFGGEDGGDLVTAVVWGSAPHPTGYPLYLLLGRIFLPLSADPARALNLASVFWGALGCGLVSLAAASFYRTLLNISHILATAGGILAGLALAFAPLVWSQALITEVYSFNLTLTGLFLLALTRWQVQSPYSVELVALVGGLAVGHHRTAIFTVIAGLLFMVCVLWNRGLHLRGLAGGFLVFLRTFILFLAGCLGTYLYFLVGSGSVPTPNWYEPNTGNLAGFWKLFSASDYQSYLLGRSVQQIPAQLSASAGLLVQQFGWPGLLLGWYGFTVLWQKAGSKPFAIFLTFGFVIHLCFAISYNAVNSQVYLIPAFVMWVIAGGYGLIDILQRVEKWLHMHTWKAIKKGWLYFAGLSLTLALIVVGMTLHYSEMDLSNDTGAVAWLNRQLQQTPVDTILVSSEDNTTFTLWYGLFVQKRRPDLVVVDTRLLFANWYRLNLNRLYPDITLGTVGLTSLDREGIRQTLAELNSQRPVILTLDQVYRRLGD